MVNVQYTEHFTFEIERATISQREREPLGTDVQDTHRSVIRGPKYWSHILYVFMVLCKANNAFHS